MYPENTGRPTPPPCGYKPYYISHIGRHGARYPLGDTVYSDLLGVFTDARARGLLTECGKDFLEVYSELYPKVAHREGELTFKGQAQHRSIARQMYRDYPAVFRGKTRAAAVSTQIHRVLVSMFSFLDEASRLDRDLVWTADYGRVYLPYLLPLHNESPSWTPSEAMPDSVEAAVQAYYDEFADPQVMLRKWFTDPSALKMEPWKLLYSMHTVFSTFDNIDVTVPQELRTMFTPSESAAVYERNNFRWYLELGRAPWVSNKVVDDMAATVKDFIDKASEDRRDGIALRLRFTHDSAMLPLLSYMDVNGMGAVVSDPREVKDRWRSFQVPMAGNLQLIFFRRSKNDPEILIQVLLNGSEATLPFPQARPGFYRWSDFVAYYRK